MNLLRVFRRAAWLLLGIAAGCVALVSLYVLGMMALALVLFPARDVTYYVEPSPDRRMSLVSKARFFGSTVSATTEVYLAGARFEDQRPIGVYQAGGAEPGDGWAGPRALNVCMLRFPLGPPDEIPDEVAPPTGTGEPAVRITRNCPPDVMDQVGASAR